MPRKKSDTPESKKPDAKSVGVVGLQAEIDERPITETLETNFMPYAMSVIVSRAIPEIDGFKPSHRKILYTMYKMGLLTGQRSKSANVVGQTMRLNPHGDAAIYETMVRLSRGYGALLHPFVDSKGNFGKVYSRDMAYAASRYTEVKLADISAELFRDIDRDTVDFIDNYDNTMKEPTLLPTTFPNVLVSANQGIAVGMASQICGFNLAEVCKATAKFIKNKNVDLLSIMPAPDFPTGGEIIYDEDAMRAIYKTGRGSFKVRARYRYNEKENLIEIYEIPYTTTVEAIMDKVSELVKAGKIKEIADIRDETDLEGLKIAIDLRRGTDHKKLMARLFAQTPLTDSFSCNFNILIAGSPRVMGIAEILEEWTAWREQCIRRKVFFDKCRLSERLHLLKGLKKILLDIDRAIKIIRETEEEDEVVPNLMIGFGIDKLQAEYIAEIRLRNINKEYILKRIAEVDSLTAEIADLEDILNNRERVRNIIISELEACAKKYGVPRRTGIVYDDEQEYREEDHIEDTPVHVFISREGYLKKITPQSLRMSGEQKYKENDGPSQYFETTNLSEMLFFTNKQQCYKARLYEFEESKASLLGIFLPQKLGMDEGENVVFCCIPGDDYDGWVIFAFENGKAARVELASYKTVSNRRKLSGAYSGKSPLVAAYHLTGEEELVFTTTEPRALIISTSMLAPKTTRSVQGVQVINIKPKYRLSGVVPFEKSGIINPSRFRVRKLPAAGAILREEDKGITQLELQ